MRLLLILLFISQNIIGQEMEDYGPNGPQTREEALKYMIEYAENKWIGKVYQAESGYNYILTETINENNISLIYKLETINRKSKRFYKKYQSKENLIYVSKTKMPNLIFIALHFDIIFQWHYYYKGKKIVDITVYPEEWPFTKDDFSIN